MWHAKPLFQQRVALYSKEHFRARCLMLLAEAIELTLVSFLGQLPLASEAACVRFLTILRGAPKVNVDVYRQENFQA